MADINPILNLNKHPKECTNLSFVKAINVKLDNDKSCITNENNIERNKTISDVTRNYNNIEIIPCNTELVIFAINDNKIDLYRYNEKDDIINLVCRGINYNYGKIKGAFTYNVHNELIISFSEYDCPNGELIPLRTINLDTIEEDVNNALLPNSPEVKIPSFNTHDYVKGTAYKGWNYIFIRYKIDDVDYTQWYQIGYPIYVDTLENKQIIKYCFTGFYTNDYSDKHEKDHSYYAFGGGFDDDKNGTGFSDYISNDLDVANETFKIILNDIDNRYNKYQIGIVCTAKTYTKCFRSADIDIDNKEFIFNTRNLVLYSAEEIIIDNYNYYNVGNITNYQNRLYISNYNEKNINSHDEHIKECVNNINIKLHIKDINRNSDITYDNGIIKNKNINSLQYDSNYDSVIPFYKFLSIPEDEDIKIFVDDIDVTENLNPRKARNFYFSKLPIDINEFGINIIYVTPGEIGVELVQYDKEDIKIQTKNKTIDFNNNTSYFLNGGCYINTNTNFNSRKIESTLIPGEVYNFFIHYVDKYGHATNGYRIDNNNVWITEDSDVEIFPIKFKDRNGDYKYAALRDINSNVIKNNNINVEDILDFYEEVNYNYFPGNLIHYGNPTLINKITFNKEEFIEDFIEYFKEFNNDKFINYKWYQIVVPIENEFNIYINNNGDRLFRVPVEDKIYNLCIENIIIPDGYVGYYISYEKFESLKQTVGLLTKSDATTQDKSETLSNPVYATELKNTSVSNNMMFYSNYFDIKDTIKLNYDIMRIDIKNPFYKKDTRFFNNILRNGTFTYMHDLNKPQIVFNKDPKNYPIPNFKLGVANDGTNNKAGVGTSLVIENKYDLFESYTPDVDNNNKINTYLVTLLNCTRDIYMSNDKTLVKLSNAIYNNENTIISNGFNGHFTYDSVIVYSMDGINFNDVTHQIKRLNKNTPYVNSTYMGDSHYSEKINYPFAEYVQYLDCAEEFHESRSFKNKPQTIVYYLNNIEEGGEKYIVKDNKDNKFWVGAMVVPINSIDLFENKQGEINELNPKTYSNYKSDINFLERFDKTVRRSNIIQDESRSNTWRQFVTEGYRMINENKGKITNLVGIGYIFLVHTEHSLFMFDINNVLKTKEKDVYLGLTDVFDVGYKELLTSELGHGGMQDGNSWILGQFGYIFYDNDAKRFYRFDNNQLAAIDDSIINWLFKYNLYNVRLINDYDNNRILIRGDYEYGNITFSYNYLINNFISLHSYIFDKGYNSKTKLYIKYDSNLYQFNKGFGKIPRELLIGDLDNKTEFSLIVNVGYELIKFLEFISYKLSKIDVSVNIDYTYSPVEKTLIPFSGDTMQVYNNNIDTGLLDINIETEKDKNNIFDYTKPYWHLGNWNFNYLRDKANIWEYGLASDMSRVYGNYFIIRFIFNNKDNNKIEFESIDYKITQSNI